MTTTMVPPATFDAELYVAKPKAKENPWPECPAEFAIDAIGRRCWIAIWVDATSMEGTGRRQPSRNELENLSELVALIREAASHDTRLKACSSINDDVAALRGEECAFQAYNAAITLAERSGFPRGIVTQILGHWRRTLPKKSRGGEPMDVWHDRIQRTIAAYAAAGLRLVWAEDNTQ